MKKISVIVFVVSLIFSSYSLVQARNYHQHQQHIIESQPSKAASLLKAFLDGFTWGLTGGGDIYAEAHRIEKVQKELADLEAKRLEARSHVFFGGGVAIVSLLVFLVVKKEDNED